MVGADKDPAPVQPCSLAVTVLARGLAGLALVSGFACVATGERGSNTAAKPAAAHTTTPSPQPWTQAARYFQGNPEDAYWVTHDDSLDRVVVLGARLELSSADGRVLASAWEAELWAIGEVIQGSLAVAPHLGGGFVHWTQRKAFRSQTFTGPLTRVNLNLGSNVTIRGARTTLQGVVILSEEGPRMLLTGQDTAQPVDEPGLYDIAALDDRRAVKLDVFGRAQSTVNGGQQWFDVTKQTGLSTRGLVVSPDELSIDTWQGKIAIAADGSLGTPDGNSRSVYSSKPYQLVFANTRASDREHLPWSWRETTPLGAAVVSGARLADGSFLGLGQAAMVRVDPNTGDTLQTADDWVPPGLDCVPVQVDEGVLMACTWEDYQGYGGYALLTKQGEPPRTEWAFSDNGFFVVDGRGAVGFVGSCRKVPRLVDSNDPSETRWGEIKIAPVFCVRRGPNDWVERTLDLTEQRTLLAWVPRKDGTAVALVRGPNSRDLLPPAVGTPRVVEERGVRVVRLYQEEQGWYWATISRRNFSYRGAPRALAEQRFAARDDGSVDGWLSSTETGDSFGEANRGVTLAPDGTATLHPLPPSVAGMVVTGDYGIVATIAGQLYETRDRGRTWQDVGPSPLPPSAFVGGCSQLGCVLNNMVRLGWGKSAFAPNITEDPYAGCRSISNRLPQASDQVCNDLSRKLEQSEALTNQPVLTCVPASIPTPLPNLPATNAQSKLSVRTPYGDEVEITRETTLPEPEPPSSYGMPQLAPAPTASAPPTPPAKATPPTLRTHSLMFRPPFQALTRHRLNATNTTLNIGRSYRRVQAIPLLQTDGEVSLLLVADGSEMLVGSGDVVTLPSYEPRRYYWNQSLVSSGLLVARDRALLLGDTRRRTTLEEHRPEPLTPPLLVGLERDQVRRRQFTLARREDGSIGIVVLDGMASGSAGIAEVDRTTGMVGTVQPLAPWSTLTSAQDPACRSMKGGWRTLLVVQPTDALKLDERALPALTLGTEGLLRVLWGRERVCLEAMDVTATDVRRRGDRTTNVRLIARWDGKRNASLLSPDFVQTMTCDVSRE